MLIGLLLIIILLIHWWPWTVVLLWKMTVLRKVPNLSIVVTWEVSIIWWVVGMNTSGIRLSWIGRNYSGSD
jgi:hypothetical protein